MKLQTHGQQRWADTHQVHEVEMVHTQQATVHSQTDSCNDQTCMRWRWDSRSGPQNIARLVAHVAEARHQEEDIQDPDAHY